MSLLLIPFTTYAIQLYNSTPQHITAGIFFMMLVHIHFATVRYMSQRPGALSCKFVESVGILHVPGRAATKSMYIIAPVFDTKLTAWLAPDCIWTVELCVVRKNLREHRCCGKLTSLRVTNWRNFRSVPSLLFEFTEFIAIVFQDGYVP